MLNSLGGPGLLKGALGLDDTPPKAQPEMGAAIELRKGEVKSMNSCTCEKRRVSGDCKANCQDCNNANCEEVAKCLKHVRLRVLTRQAHSLYVNLNALQL